MALSVDDDRRVAAGEPRHYRGEGYEIHPARRLVLRDGREVDLGARAFDLLVALLESRDRVLAKHELLERVWPGLVVEENTLQVQVSLLRKRLGANAIATVPGRGYRFVGVVAEVGGGAHANAPTPPTAKAPRLPAPATRFIGREGALADALRLLRGRPTLTLTGAGGSGKTRLALEIARTLGAEGAAVWFADLSGLDRADGVLPAIAAALGVADRADAPMLEAVAARLGEAHGVLVVDNCEHLSAEVARVLRHASAERSGVQVLATSQHPLQVPGEQLYAVPALALPLSRGLGDIEASEAVRLFVDRARLVVPGFALDADNAGAVADICIRLDGIPLALELAAARIKLLSVAQLSARLDERFRLLVGGPGDVPRQQTLRESVRWSYELLAPAEQASFRALGVFSSGWTLDAAAAVCGCADEYDALERLTSLYDKSLITVDRAQAGPPRYAMLQTVRQFAREALDPRALAETQDRHLAFFVGLAHRLVPRPQASLDAASATLLRREHDNLAAALAWCHASPSGASAALRLVGSLWPYWLASAQLERGHAFAGEALRLAEAGDASDAERGRALLGIGNLAFYRGRYDEAMAHAGRALGHARAAGDRVATGFGLKLLAGAHHALGHEDLALVHYTETLEVALAMGDRALQAAAHNNLAEVHRGLGHVVQAGSAYRMAIDLAREIDDRTTLAVVLCNLARLLSLSARPREAAAALLEAHGLAVQMEHRRAGDDVIDIAAGIAAASAQHAVAARFYGASLARFRESGSQREPLDEAFLSPLIEASRAALGQAAFDTAMFEGSLLPYPDAMADVAAFLSGSAAAVPPG